jgi:hypothetical protein
VPRGAVEAVICPECVSGHMAAHRITAKSTALVLRRFSLRMNLVMT